MLLFLLRSRRRQYGISAQELSIVYFSLISKGPMSIWLARKATDSDRKAAIPAWEGSNRG